MAARVVDLREPGARIRLFTNIAIETSSLCNRTCTFCPNAHTARPDEQMGQPLLDSLARQLGELRYRGRIEFYLYNEPLRDPRIREIIAQFRKQVPGACLMLATNGDYLKSPGDVCTLLTAGLNQLQVNVYDGGERRVRQLRALCKIGAALATWAAAAPRSVDLDGRLPMYHPIARSRATAQVVDKCDASALPKTQQLTNRSGNIPWLAAPTPQPLERMCARPFRFLNIAWTGKAVLCCNDYHHAVVVGDAHTQTLRDIWDSERLTDYRIALRHKNRRLLLCASCDYHGGHYLHTVQHVTRGPAADSKLLLRMEET